VSDLSRKCAATTADSRPCEAAPLTDGDYCFLHAPEKADEADAARALGGKRRKRHNNMRGPDSMSSLKSLDKVLRFAVGVALGADRSLTQARTLGGLVQIGLAVHQRAEMDDRLAALEDRVAEMAEPWRAD
jgi:hypothetical protein